VRDFRGLAGPLRPVRLPELSTPPGRRLTSDRLVLKLAQMAESAIKPVIWIGSSLRDLRQLSGAVQDEIGYALYFAQQGRRHQSAKALKGFGGAGVLEIVQEDSGGTYRAVYTVEFAGVIYVLHVFQKKSKKGIRTPRTEIDLIHRRLAVAANHYREYEHEFNQR
jgi:phage-related protein